MKKSVFSRLVNKYGWATPANIDTARAWERAKAKTEDYILSHTIEGAWDIIKSMFPELKWRCGADETHYRAYYNGELAADYMYVCVLGNTLELNLPNGETFRVNYRVYSFKPLWEIEHEQEAEKEAIREKIGEEEAEETKMTEKELTAAMEEDLEEALSTYEAHTTEYVHHGSGFVRRMARDSVQEKTALREILSRHQAWNEREQRLAVPITVPQSIDETKVRRLVDDLTDGTTFNSFLIQEFLLKGKCFNQSVEYLNDWGVYRPDAKRTKILAKILKKEGLWEEKQGVFSSISDEVNKKDIGLTLYISINPADQVTMSNPQYPTKGKPFMQSCHSLDSDCEYHRGASGYARDGVSFITYTVAEGDSKNRWYKKTNRQMFAFYEGTLLQSRLYTTFANGESYGGVYHLGEREEKLQNAILAAVQRVFSECLNKEWGENKEWGDSCLYKDADIKINCGFFGGYPDWVNYPHLARVSHFVDEAKRGFTIGHNAALCLECGDESPEYGLYCDSCYEGEECAECGEHLSENDGHWVRDRDGNLIQVCDSCFDEYFYCEDCGEYHHTDRCVRVFTENGERDVCETCAERNYQQCEECGTWVDRSYTATNQYGRTVEICQDCAENSYVWCGGCGELYHYDLTQEVDGELYCEDCAEHCKAEA